ncbi:MAG: sugar transferase [Bacteroidota bacterium]
MKKQNGKSGNSKKLQLRFLSIAPFFGTGALSAAAETQPSGNQRKKRRNRPNLEKIGGMEPPVRDFINQHVDFSNPFVTILRTSGVSGLGQLNKPMTAIVNLRQMNDVKETNKFLSAVNGHLIDGGLFIGCVETKYVRKKRILNRYPAGIGHGLVAFDYFYKRFLPKIPATARVCRAISGDMDKARSSTEALGRIYAAGFEVLERRFIGGLLYIAARKVKKPLFDYEPVYGPIFRVRRHGKGGKPIYVFKMRTMHAYSEFIQQFVYDQNNLDVGGKLKDDFRVSSLGKIARKYWIDELPMIWNLLTGDLKLVGVRPLSAQYLSLYSEELKELRLQHRPGLVPPYYADMPKTIEEIQASEMRYLKAHERHPFLTDVRYFCKAAWNILFCRARSK